MKNIYLIICLFIFPIAVIAQNQSIDSLKSALKTVPQDTVRVNMLNNVSTAFIQTGNFDSAFKYIKSSVGLLEKLHYQSGAVLAYHNLAAYNFHIKEYKTGKFFLLKSLSAALLTHDKKNIAVDYKELADLYELQSNFKQARESNRKFVLYRDSSAKEESAKHEAGIVAVPDLKEKKETDFTATNNDTKEEIVNYKQQIIYIAVGAFLLLVILIIWLTSRRNKRRAFLSRRNAEALQKNILKEPIQFKNADVEKGAFLQKIAERESLNMQKPVESTQIAIKNVVPIVTADKSESVEENLITKAEIKENIVLDKTGKAILNLATEIPVNKTEINPETKQKQTNQNTLEVEEKANNIKEVDVAAKYDIAIINRQYSELLFAEQLPYFSIILINNAIKIVWKTVDEKDMVHFEVEKSADGAQYVSIETITARGFGSNCYEMFDFKPLPGRNYYRLLVIDTDNNFIYSPIVQVEVMPVSTLTLICYPTHVKEVIMVTAAGGKLPVLVNIFNKAGERKFSIETPPNTTPIYLTSLSAGAYTLQMKCQGKTILQQLIKVA